MSGIEDLVFKGIDKLVEVITDKVVEETGVDRKLTFPAVDKATRMWVAAERAAVTKARADALAKGRAKRKP